MHSLLPLVAAFALIPLGHLQQTCIQNLPPFVGQSDAKSSALGPPPPSNPMIQAIIPQYIFNCTGFVTQWNVVVKMMMPRSMSFQVWRLISSSPAVYSLVGTNPVTNVGQGTQTFSIVPSATSQISVMAGDVIGYSYGGTSGDWRIQVTTQAPQITAYYVTTTGTGSGNTATLSTYTPTPAAPIISAVLRQVAVPSSQISAATTAFNAIITSTPPFSVTTSQASMPQGTLVQETTTLTTSSITTTSSNQSLPVVVIVVVATALLTVLILIVSVTFILLFIRQHRRKHSVSVKREAMNQYYTDTVLQTLSLVPSATKTQDGFHTMPELRSSSSYSNVIGKNPAPSVDSPNHYTLAQSSVDDCRDDVVGQLYTVPMTTLVRTNATDEPNIAVGRYEMVEMNTYNTTTFTEETYWSPALTASGLYEQLAAHKCQEIPLSHIRILNVLGSGQFGQVSRGLWEVSTICTEVAVKTLKDRASEEDKVKFLQEAAIMGQFSHPNVVTMYGVVTVGDPPMIVLELMNGDLHSFLIEPTILQRYGQKQLKKIFLKFSQEIAFGMLYLSRKSFVHRDLAARNILITKDLTCKIGDFGMARDLIDEGVYYATKGGVVPVKWTAPEALLYNKYSTASDVYSFGMVLFEIWGLGTKPFKDLRNMDIPQLARLGYCLPPPPGCPRAVYSHMVDCWHPHHDKRPHFGEVVNYFKKPEELLLFWSKEDHTSAGGGVDLGSSLSSTQHLFPDLQNRYKDSQQHC